MKPASFRNELIDGIRVVAMQVIVLHHLVSYGPLADATQALIPDIFDWLYAHGRIAVQVFLVIGGFLAARSVSALPSGKHKSFAAMLFQRYLRLAPAYGAALLLAIFCATYARHWIEDGDFIPGAPTLTQWLAHILLLQNLLGHEPLTTGVWYVAIDFQLFVLLAVIARLRPKFALPVTLLLAVASMFWFNLVDELDDWAIYFFGAYALGAVAWWASSGEKHAVLCQRLLWLAAIVALLIEFRSRLSLALCTALLLNLSCSRLFARIELPRSVAAMGRITYAQFLAHFPVYMLVSALFVRQGWLSGHWSGCLGIMVAWVLSIPAAILLHQWIEKPTGRIRLNLSGLHAAFR